jgi:tetratricopeptide repeat protein 21B
MEYIIRLNPCFLLELVRDLLEHAPSDPRRGEEPHQTLLSTKEILELLSAVLPGYLEGFYLLGRVKYLLSDKLAAQTCIANCLKIDPGFYKVRRDIFFFWKDIEGRVRSPIVQFLLDFLSDLLR